MKKIYFVLLIIFVLGLSGSVLAETTATYDLSWWTVDGGGVNNSTSGDYTLSGTVGQPDAGVSSSDNYDLAGGFWAGILSKIMSFLPLIKK